MNGAPATGGASVAASASAARATTSVGMAVALGAVTMTFAALLLAYAIVRVQSPTWPPPGEAAVPRAWLWPIAATLAAIAGSVAVQVARRAADGASTERERRLRRALGAAATAGVSFVAIQTAAWLWLVSRGVRPHSGIVASVVYALTLFHALHAVAALIALLPLLVRALRGRTLGTSRLRAVAAFWHLVTAAWMVVFLAVFVA